MKRNPDSNLRGFKGTRYLSEEERCRLLYGPYEPPLVKGGFLVDAVRGKVRFSHFTNARIRWPKYQKQAKGGSGGFVLCGDLVRALRDEAAPAIAYHWGVSHATIVNWRRALELTGLNAGSYRLMGIGVNLARRPESRARRSAAMRGKVLSRKHKHSLHSAMQAGWKERYMARRRAYLRTGRFPKATKADPWIPEEEDLLRRHSTRELARIIWRTSAAITAQRIALGIRLRPSGLRRPWEKWEIKLLGRDKDVEVAKRLKRTLPSVTRKRVALGIGGFTPQQRERASASNKGESLCKTASTGRLMARNG